MWLDQQQEEDSFEVKLVVLGGFWDKGALFPFWDLCVGGFEGF